MTRAQDQAGFLRALAAHLDMHYDLHPPYISWASYRPADLQVGADDRTGAALLAWVESLDVDEVTVRRVAGGSVHPYAEGRVGGHAVRVWDTVSALDDTELLVGEVVDIDVLRDLQ